MLSFVKNKKPMARIKAFSEDVVLNSAMNVFWNNGYEATSVRLLEKEMGINQFSIYASFSNKKNLFIESIKKYREYVKEHVFYDLLQENAGLAELELFLQKKVQKTNAVDGHKGCLVVNTAAEIGTKDKEIAREIELYYDFIYEIMTKVIRNAIAKGEVPADTDVEIQAGFFLGIMQGFSVASKTMDEKRLLDFISVAIKQIR
ncbi:MAG: TetR/AcrR family transcriptional regulator [Bacteroidetes bacterium HGW-Bacteroidetes-12]|nr:MAG: TetR/AcrR family transcriptional regulator [Bacteroidetes bacterium HGW-Bacteroidetes-12]